jgi:AraC-like DNA-binding protein
MAGIVFKPSAVATLFRVPMPECTNCRIPLDALLGPTAPELAEKLAEAGDFRQKVAVLEGFLLDHIRRQPFTIDLGDHAADIILERKGIVSVQDLADELGVNRRQLERKFMSKVGLSPKYYARVKRISYVCSLLVGEKNLDWQDAISQGGYYDQSHFIKDFQEFVRQNPSLYYKGHNELINFLKK